MLSQTISYAAFVVGVLWLGLIIQVGYEYKIGIEHPKTQLLRSCFLLITPMFYFYDNVIAHKPMAPSLVSAGVLSVIVYVELILFALFNSRSANMKKAYGQYDAYRRDGHNPIIIADSIFGPVVERDRPWNVQTSMIASTTNGKLDSVYEVTSWRKYRRAKETFGSGPD